MLKRAKSDQPAPSQESLAFTMTVIRKCMDVPPALVDPRKHLDAGEQNDLVGLARRLYTVQPHEPGHERPPYSFDREAVKPKEWARWKALCAKAVGDPDLFTNREAVAEVRGKAAEMLREINPVQRRPRYEEPGAVILPARVFEQVKKGALPIEKLGVLVFFLLQLEHREALSFGASVEGDQVVFQHDHVTIPGDAITPGQDIIDPNAQSRMSHTQLCRLLDGIANQPPVHRWLEVEKSGPTWRVRLGPAALDAAEKRAAA